ncbi:hypothetical protein TNCT_648001 [Trichonephila clavata]|uniref:Uncharacterized protein n=1 Tax=Trichonephila clavata TaxID=2740835 RepID=A0A8X6GU36_TRICU|nr:hypothetical protein TNCT_648001 [Trichonephila clavata]
MMSAFLDTRSNSFYQISRYLTKCVRINIRYCMKGVTLKFIKRLWIIPEGEIFQISPKEKSGVDETGERGGQSPLEMTRLSKDSVKTSILSHDV